MANPPEILGPTIFCSRQKLFFIYFCVPWGISPILSFWFRSLACRGWKLRGRWGWADFGFISFFYCRAQVDINKRLSLPADLRLPDSFISKELSPVLDGPLTRATRRQSLAEIGFGRSETYTKLDKLGEVSFHPPFFISWILPPSMFSSESCY